MVGDDRLAPHSVVASGAFKNFNTIEDFKAADKTALFNQASERG
jgi:ubiquitin-like modifier-activating enzyme ATG7